MLGKGFLLIVVVCLNLVLGAPHFGSRPSRRLAGIGGALSTLAQCPLLIYCGPYLRRQYDPFSRFEHPADNGVTRFTIEGVSPKKVSPLFTMET